MRTDGSGKVVKLQSNEPQDNIRNTRKTLRVLQSTATDKENLVGRVQRSGKDLTSKLSQSDHAEFSAAKTKIKLINKGTQTGPDTKIDVKDLTSEDGPSENYWQIIAEKRRVALDESLDQNRSLIEENVALKEENRICKEMLEESKSLVEVLTEMLGETEDGATEAKEADETIETAEEATEKK